MLIFSIAIGVIVGWNVERIVGVILRKCGIKCTDFQNK